MLAMDEIPKVRHASARAIFACVALLTLALSGAFVADVLLHPSRDGPYAYGLLKGPDAGQEGGDYVLWTYVQGSAESRLWGRWSAPAGADRFLVIPGDDLQRLVSGENPSQTFFVQEGSNMRAGSVDILLPDREECSRCGGAGDPVLALVWLRGDAWEGANPNSAETGVWYFPSHVEAISGAPVDFRSHLADAALLERVPWWEGIIVLSGLMTIAAALRWAFLRRASVSGNSSPAIAGTTVGRSPTEEMLHLVDASRAYVRLVSRYWLAAGVAITIAGMLIMLLVLPPAYEALVRGWPEGTNDRAALLLAIIGPFGTAAALLLWLERYVMVRREVERWRQLTDQFDHEARVMTME